MAGRSAAMVVVTVPVGEVDLASDRLWALGVRAVEERTPAGVLDGGHVELWTSVGDRAASERVRAELTARWPTAVVDVDAAPADTWREHAAPMWIGPDLVIVPAWRTSADASRSDPTVTVVPIEPGGAFGLGDHPTTRLCLHHVASLDGDAIRGRHVLDVGCGTGVLSVVAALRGADRVRAIDVADAAVAATMDNARRNGVSDRVVVDDRAAAEVDGEYDIVLANILAPELIALAGDLRRLTAPTGTLVISGILAGAHGHVLDALRPMVAVRTDVLDGWAAVVLRHPGGAVDGGRSEQRTDGGSAGE